MNEYETEFEIRHKRPICVTQDALIELAQIMDFARASLMPPTPELEEEGTESEGLERLKRQNNAIILENYEREFSPTYGVGFSSGFRPSKRSIDKLLETLNAEPDAPVEIEFYLGSSYASHFRVKVGDIYGANASVRVSGPDAAAESVVRRVRNWLKVHEPEYPWLRSSLAYIIASALAALLGAAIAVYSNFKYIKTFVVTNPTLNPVLGSCLAVFMIGLFAATYSVMKKSLPHRDFQLGWSRKKSKFNKSLIAGLVSLLIAPTILHWLGLT